MTKDKPIYVIDTNVVIDYEDIIPALSGPVGVFEEPTIDLSEAHLVIPSVVIRELSSFKGEKSERGKAARTVLKRIREIFESDLRTMDDMYHLNASVDIGKQKLSILPVHKNFSHSIPFKPSDADMDGQIILTALSAEYLLNELPVDGSAKDVKFVTRLNGEVGIEVPQVVTNSVSQTTRMEFRPKTEASVILLTNDNGLAIRARERGLNTMRYGHKCPPPYTGRRDIVVPPDLFAEFINTREISRELFEEKMPNEPKLVANEFIVMSLENPEDYPAGYDIACDHYFERIGRYDAVTDTIMRLKFVSSFPVTPKNPGQAIYAEALMNPKFAAVICTGPAGSGKTYMATIYGYRACVEGQFIGVTVVPCESRSKLGALPGDLDEKMDPDMQPLKNALRNYLLHEDSGLRKELATIQKFGVNCKGKKNGNGSSKGDSSDHGGSGRGDSGSSGYSGFSGDEFSEGPQKRSIKVKLADRVENIWDNWFSSVPIENARGRDFAYELAIYDEFQDQNAMQADTLIKRLGSDGKIVLTGDIRQIHAVYLDQFNNGLVYASKLLFDNPMVAQVCFHEDEVVRHPLVQIVAKRQETGEDDEDEVVTETPSGDGGHSPAASVVVDDKPPRENLWD